MTPLVDVAFLLLTFFMFTTTMMRPQTMEINLPPDKEVKVEMAESNLLTLRINDKGRHLLEYRDRIAQEAGCDDDLRTFLKEKIAVQPEADRPGEGRPGREVHHDGKYHR